MGWAIELAQGRLASCGMDLAAAGPSAEVDWAAIWTEEVSGAHGLRRSDMVLKVDRDRQTSTNAPGCAKRPFSPVASGKASSLAGRRINGRHWISGFTRICPAPFYGLGGIWLNDQKLSAMLPKSGGVSKRTRQAFVRPRRE